MSDPSGTSSLERQLGEVVGTMRMTVNAVESLRESVEKLAERSAFRADLDAARHEWSDRFERERSERKEEQVSDRAKFSELQRRVYIASGALAALAFIANQLPNIIRLIGLIGQ